MKTLLVTGAAGFIGKNLCAQLEQEKDVTVLRFGRNDGKQKLEEYIGKADFIFHIAGVNRPKKEKEFDEGNTGLTKTILSMLEKSGKKTPLLLTSSAQATLDNPYGKSKKAAETAVLDWAKRSGSQVYVYRLPGVFGKWCKPNYNSVVATFCHNMSRGLDIQVNDQNAELTLVYIDDVVCEFIKALRGNLRPSDNNRYKIPRGFKITLGELVDKLTAFKESRENLQMPDLVSGFDRFLYATYISYLNKDSVGYELDVKTDDRGWLTQFIKSEHFGQINISLTKPGVTRGIHWHNTKIEKFLVVSGHAEVRIRDYYSDEVSTYTIDSGKLQVLEMPAGRIHSIKNIGKEDMMLVIWAHEIFDPENPDTYYKEV